MPNWQSHILSEPEIAGYEPKSPVYMEDNQFRDVGMLVAVLCQYAGLSVITAYR